MEQGYVYLNELNSNSKNYSVKVKVVEKSRARTSKKGLLFQNLVLSDEKGNNMKAILFGEQVDSFNEAIVYNSQYIISNAPIKIIEERWRSNSDGLPFQMTFGGQTVVQKVNDSGTVDGPLFQSLQSIPRVVIAGSKYDVLGVVLYVEDKVRIVNGIHGQEYHVREIVITDQTIDQPVIISAWNDLADKDCDAISLYAKTFDVIGFTALRASLHKGFSLSTGMSTEIIYDPKGEKAKILTEWARFHTQQLLDLQTKVLQVRSASMKTATINIHSLKTKKPCDVLQEERHWLRVTIPDANLKNIVAYIGCSACGKRIDIPVGTEFSCTFCKKKDSISAYRATFKFEAIDDSGSMIFSTFTSDTEKLFGISAHEIHLIKESDNVQMFDSIQQQLCDFDILVQVGPTTALSRNNVLQWCLKGIKVEANNTAEDSRNFKSVSTTLADNHNAKKTDEENLSSGQNELKQVPKSHIANPENVKETIAEATDNMDIARSMLELSQPAPKKRYIEAHMTKIKGVGRDDDLAMLGDLGASNPILQKQVPSGSVHTISVSSVNSESIPKKSIAKKRSMTSLYPIAKTMDIVQKNDSEINVQLQTGETKSSCTAENQITQTFSTTTSEE